MLGPFELVKIVAQLGGDIADRKHQTTRPQAQAAPGNSSGLSTTSVTQANKKIGSYQAFRTILRNRGVAGLYSGFSLHLSELTLSFGILSKLISSQLETRLVQLSTSVHTSQSDKSCHLIAVYHKTLLRGSQLLLAGCVV